MNSTDSPRFDEAAAATAAAEQYLALIFNNSANMMALFRVEAGPTLRLISLNQAYLNVVRAAGYPIASEDLIGKTLEDLFTNIFRFPDEDIARQLNRYCETVATGQPLNYEEIHDTPNGRYYGETTLTPVRAADGTCAYVLFSSNDVTGRRLTEENLRDSEERYRRLFETESDAIVMVDRDTGRFVDANPAALKLYGYSHEEFMGMGSTDVSSEPNQTRQAIANREMKVPLRFHHKKDGTVFPVEINANYFTARGRNFHVAAIRDLTAQKRIEETMKGIEEELRQAHKLEAIGTLAGGIAHDFNNILSAIYAYTALARAAAVGNTELCGYLDEIGRAGRRATDLVRQILVFSRAQGEDEVMTAVPLGQLADETVKLLRATSPSSIEFVTRLEPDLPGVQGSATQLHQVVLNLGTNAVQAMHDGPGRLSLSLESCTVDEARARTLPGLQPGRFVRLTVGDTGSGMDAATQARIFEPFFTTKEPGKGTGLGLSVVHGIVRNHRGAIRLNSTTGCGTTFEVFLPVATAPPPPAPAAPAAPAEIPRGQGECILVVDDEEALAHTCKIMLRQLGYAAESDCQALEALARLERDPQAFRLVISDQTMPGMTGLDFARRIHELRADLPVVLTSGYSSALTAERLRAAGVGEVLPKPYTMHLLATMVRRQLAAHQPNPSCPASS